MKKFDVVTIGAAVQDVFLSGAQFPLGAKIEVDEVTFSTGGGATNAAVTFGRFGYDVAFAGKIGHDLPGTAILEDLKENNVSTERVAYTDKEATGYSVLLLATNGERTILTYRGASEKLAASDLKLDELSTDWLYITSLAGNISLLEKILSHAQKQSIHVLLDAGKDELEHPNFKKLINKVTVLKGNKEELATIFRGETPKEIVQEAVKQVPVVLLTDGPRGSFASDGLHMFQSGTYEEVKVVDRTGAGDAFGSGFVAKLIDGAPLEEALTFASANSTSVVKYIGAKEGILHRTSAVHKMDIKVTKL